MPTEEAVYLSHLKGKFHEIIASGIYIKKLHPAEGPPLKAKNEISLFLFCFKCRLKNY
jgi:hypothetical protein